MSEALNEARLDTDYDSVDHLVGLPPRPRLVRAHDEQAASDRFVPKEVAKWYAQINRSSVGDYLSDLDQTGGAEIADEVLALIALYATTRKRQVGLERTVDILIQSLEEDSLKTADTHDISVSNVGARRSQAAVHVAQKLDELHGLAPVVPKGTARPEPASAPTVSAGQEPDETPPQQPGERYVGDDHLKMYLNSIGKVPLLNAELEVELAKRNEAGLVAHAVAQGHAGEGLKKLAVELQATDEELEWLIQDGRAAYDHFISANTRLAVNLAKKYFRATTSSMQLEDRIQVGNEALFRAVDKFDYKRGYKFSTYATWWIRQGIQRALADESRTIRIPVHMTEKVSKVTKFRHGWLIDKGVEPTNEETAAELDMKLSDVDRIVEIIRMQPVSLNLKVDDDGNTELVDLLDVEPSDGDVDDQTTKSILLQNVRNVIRTIGLTERETEVIERRWGIGSATGEGETLDDIGKDYGVTRERIRQIEGKVRARLSHSPELAELNKALSEDD